ALHLLFVCVDSEVWSDYTRRDDPIYEQEVVELFIGSGEAPPSIYREFELSPFNVQWDGRIVSPTGDRKDMTADVAWDACSFDSAVRIARSESQQLPQCEGWSARLSIGFADLSDNAHTPAHGDVWRANFLRIEHRPHEQYLAWSPTLKSPADYHVPARFGRLILVG
ncbi:MAG: carbohydrate-binding family 9-like protein, partial [Armatimonadetes bacterium]|nr:carbohydrate-binding family 9-like protein [Armatimonadota bacterium]